MRKASSSLLLYTNNQKQELLNAYGEKCKKENEILLLQTLFITEMT